MADELEIARTHRQELRRGTVVLASLLALRSPEYGYALLETLAGHGLQVDANTLYPLLRRLEEQGLLTSEWDTSTSRPRKFYATSPAGAALAGELLDEFGALGRAFASLTQGADR